MDVSAGKLYLKNKNRPTKSKTQVKGMAGQMHLANRINKGYIMGYGIRNNGLALTVNNANASQSN